MAPLISTQKIFLKSSSGTYSYPQLNHFTLHLKSYLNKKKVQKPQPVGIISSSNDEVIFLVAACWLLGIPFICFNKNEKEKLLRQQIKRLKPGLIFTDEKKRADRASIYVNIHELPINIWQNSNAGQLKTPVPPDQAIFAYFFTSGTTSSPKIVPLKRRQMKWATSASANNIKLTPNDFWLLCMPLHHIGGVSIILRSLIYKTAIYRVDSFKLLPEILNKDEAVKAVSLVPTMLKRLLDDNDFKPHRQLKILLGGGPIHRPLLRTAVKKNLNVITSYGMTETCAQIAAKPVKSMNDESVGFIFEQNEVQIRDTNGRLQAANKSGAIWLKGPQVFGGYYNEKSQPFDESGWFNTGDFGRIDKEGRLYIETRRTDLIITGGENVSPTEVEEALLGLTGIKEASATGLPDKEWGQIVAAALVIDEHQKLDANLIKQKLKEVLPSYKIPRKIVIVATLPRTNTGKIRRNELKKLFQS